MTASSLPPWPYVSFGDPDIDALRIVAMHEHYLVTDTGRRILDASAGAAVGNIGWGRPEPYQAIASSLGAAGYVLPPLCTVERERLVERLRRSWLPAPLSEVSFMGSGSEVVDSAIRLARQYHVAAGQPNRWKVIGRDVSYHGTSLSALAVGGHAARRETFSPMLMDSPRFPPCYCLRCPLGKESDSCATECADTLEWVIAEEGAESIAACIVEPIVGASGGVLVPPEDYLRRVAAICRHHGILLIVDEVMTGIGRTGKPFAVDHWGVTPDILLMGKGLSGGYFPISALATSADFARCLVRGGQRPMYHTYDAHPAACAAADKVLEIIESEGLLNRVERLAPVMKQKMQRLAAHPKVAEVRGKGLLYALEVVRDRATLERYPVAESITLKLVKACLRRDCFVYFGGTGQVRDILLVAPHFTISDSELDRIVTTLVEALDEVCGGAADQYDS